MGVWGTLGLGLAFAGIYMGREEGESHPRQKHSKDIGWDEAGGR
jgi:hypothetical protein